MTKQDEDHETEWRDKAKRYEVNRLSNEFKPPDIDLLLEVLFAYWGLLILLSPIFLIVIIIYLLLKG